MIFPGIGLPQQHHYKKFPTRAWFEYHCWESEESADAELWHHTHQQVEILRILTPDESDYEMYEVRFADGFTAHADWDELYNTKKKFWRPDYAH